MKRGTAQRNTDLAAIHVAKKALGLSEDEYRDLMSTVCGGIRSAGELDAAGRARFRAHLQACQRAHEPTKRQPLLPHERKIWSLWMQLADRGMVHHRHTTAINAWVRRQTGVETMRWLNGHQQQLVIESLKLWLASRHGPAGSGDGGNR
ncbi:MAG: regulatory protein GemA [Rubrivivax sp.]|nr:regulatory protein GemA [Rubrivivax sp.]MDP3612584.1 regulatory protein GemA [Rubrivivax sp.]